MLTVLACIYMVMMVLSPLVFAEYLPSLYVQDDWFWSFECPTVFVLPPDEFFTKVRKDDPEEWYVVVDEDEVYWSGRIIHLDECESYSFGFDSKDNVFVVDSLVGSVFHASPSWLFNA